jgi:hypothetical protein
MALGMTVTAEDWQSMHVQVNLTGLTVGTKYDLMRLHLHHTGYNSVGTPLYERWMPDRKTLWSAVAHRVGWTATKTSHSVIDYDVNLTPHQYFIVATSAEGPFEYTNWAVPYPTSRGYLHPVVTHLGELLRDEPPGFILLRSTNEPLKFVKVCVVEVDEMKYTARGTELAVMGNQYPVYIADTRQARRGSIVVKITGDGAYNTLRDVVFPNTGAIWPVILQRASWPNPLFEDMKVIPLDVTVEQPTKANPFVRFARIDFVEVDPTSPLLRRTGDNDDAIAVPKANFTLSDTTPARNQWITLTDTSTGQYDQWDWNVPGNTAIYATGYAFPIIGGTGPGARFQTKGPHQVIWAQAGTYEVSLRVYGTEIDAQGHTAGSSLLTKKVVVT